MKRTVLILIWLPLSLFLSCTACSLPFGNEEAPSELKIMSWNVQNLFDDVSNGGEYDEFDPAKGQWNSTLFRLRLKRIREVITQGVGEYPQILLLQEVENENAMEMLNSDFLKKKYDWRVLLEEEDMNIHTAVLSSVPVSSVTKLETGYWGRIRLRPILEVHFDLGDQELIIFNNHWKSRSGGSEATEEGRIQSAQVLTSRIKDLVSENPQALIVAAGDFNENHDEYKKVYREYRTALISYIEDVPSDWNDSLFTCSKGYQAGFDEGRLSLFSPWYDVRSGGSYVYKSRWNKIDHFFLWKSFFDNRGYEYDSLEVIKEDFQLNEYGFPARWESYSEKGYSDHLPLLLRLVDNPI